MMHFDSYIRKSWQNITFILYCTLYYQYLCDDKRVDYIVLNALF